MIDLLGKRIPPADLAKRLGIGLNSVYTHARELGGIRIGRRWVFLESNVLAALGGLDANQSNKQQNGEKGVVREGFVERQDVHEEVPDQKTGSGMGAVDEKRAGRPDPYRHGLIVGTF